MSGSRRPYRSASRPNRNAPTGRNASVAVRVSAISASVLWNSRPMAVRQETTRKKSKASRVQPRYPARRAERRSPGAGVDAGEAISAGARAASRDVAGQRGHGEEEERGRGEGLRVGGADVVEHGGEEARRGKRGGEPEDHTGGR